METFLQFIRNLWQRFLAFSPTNKAVALGGVALVTGALVSISLWVQVPDYQLLYANLSDQDAAAVVEQLDSQNIPRKLTHNGRNILVPSNRVHEIRLSLASQGLPAGTEVGLELFDDTPIGMPEFVQKLNFQRALQGELARTIKSIEAVESARVHLVIPKDELFLREKQEGKASVMVKLHASRTLTQGQIQGIVHLVSSSVAGIPPGNVVLVDPKGNLLSGNQAISEDLMLTSSNYKHKRQVETEMEQRIVMMLEEALGAGKVIARINADMNFDKVVRTEELYDPDSQVVRSEQTTTESMVGTAPPGGVPGVESLVPGEEGTPEPGTSNAPTRTKEKQTLNFEINKVVKQISQTTGTLKRLSISVLIDGSMAGNPPQYQARSQEEMAKYLNLVKTSIGFDQKRGDQIQMENIQFDKSMELQQKEELALDRWVDLGKEVAIWIFGIIFVLWFLYKVLLPLVRWVTTSVEVIPGQLGAATPEELEAMESEMRLARQTQENVEIRKSVGDFVNTDPKYAASILRKWMRERT
ncbi:MAG: flagellar basal-body MS-ring/collar protein FliF [Nitrospinae bacterium]|nr:flagellar basal-body MS-ring/collar protein FliF [Nitrospinota bacterium]